jgi:hypothetical protein
MASSRIDVRVDGKDNTSSAFNSVSSSISKLNSTASKAGQTIGSAIGKGAQTASTTIGKLGTTASSAFQKIASAASSAGSSITSSFSGISGALAGLTAGYGALEVAQSAWSGAVSQDFNKQFLATKVGTAAANEYVSTIQNIVAAVPGPDSWMNNLLSGAVAKQTNLSSAELQTLADMSASYYLTATGMGKSSIETQNDLNEYIKTGNTSQLERDSILKDQLGTLENQGTVSDRIKALQAAMVADGYDQVSQLDTLGNKWETFNGLIGKAATSLGNAVAPAIMAILGALTDLDSATGGISTTIGLIGVSLVGIVGTAGALSGPLTGAWTAITGMGTAMKTVATNIASAVTKMWEYVVAAKAGDKADDGVGSSKGGTTTTTSKSGGAVATVASGLAAIGVADLVTQHIVTPIYDTIGNAFGGGASFKAYDTLIDWLGLGNDKSVENYNQKITDMANKNGANVQTMDQQWAQLKSQFTGVGSSMSSVGINTGNTIKNAFTSSAAQIRGAWGNTVSWIRSGASQAAAGANAAWSWIRSGAQSAFSAAGSAWGGLQGWVAQGASGVVSVAYGSIQSAISAVWSLYSALQSVVSRVWTAVVSTVTGPGGPGPRGPRGPEDGINFKYENYGGWQKNAWTGDNSMSGNCADMTTGLIGRFGGSMVSGTWNGNPHVWWKRPDGTEFDPARKALQGTGSPPPRGPGVAASGNVVVVQGDIYDGPGFEKVLEKHLNDFSMKVM